MIIDIDIVEPSWGDVAGIVNRSAAATLDHLGVDGSNIELAIRMSNDEEVQRLNNEYRGNNKPTNVLSFEADVPDQKLPEQYPRLLGDVILAYETVREEAVNQEKSLENHLSHLIVHGVLHLVGYDHQDQTSAQSMETLEISILEGLGIANPYFLKEIN